MKKKNLILLSFLMVSLFSSCSSMNKKNTIGFMYYFNESFKTCTIGAKVGFNMEDVYIPNSVIKDGIEYKIIGINSNQQGEDKSINVDFLEGNKYIKNLVIDNKQISSFPWDLFRSSSLKSADLSKATALTIMGDHVFTDSKLENIILPPNLETTYNGVFAGTLLKEVNFPDTYVDMGIDTFFNCKKLEKVNLGNNITYVSGSAFERDPLLKEVIAPSLKEINQFAFKDTFSLKKLDFKFVNYVGYMSFHKSGIEEVTLEDAYLETNCFKESSLKVLKINNCDKIPYKAFSSCQNLENVSLSGKIYEIASNAFSNCNFKTLSLPDSLKNIGSEAFSNCKNITQIVFPKNLEVISTNAFYKCNLLDEVIFNKNIKRIYDGAFLKTALKSVTLPNNVELLGNCFGKECQIIKE